MASKKKEIKNKKVLLVNLSTAHLDNLLLVV